MWPEGFTAFHGFAPTPGFTLGKWEYICVDPTGLRLRRSINYSKSQKTGGQLNNGEVFLVCERGTEGSMLWLCLADGRGWAFERTDRRRCSQIIPEDVPEAMRNKQLMINPCLGRPLYLRGTPCISNAASALSLLPGTFAMVVQRATVIVQAANKHEQPRVFARLAVDDIDGWAPEAIDDRGSPLLVDCKYETPDNLWISVITRGGQARTFPNPGHCGDALARAKVSPGDIFPVEQICDVSGVLFYKLPDGGWIPETSQRGEKWCSQVSREDHWYQYSCCDKEGAAVRHAPTRATNMNTGKSLKHKQRVCISEMVKFPDGDTFLHVEPPIDGWVPLSKLGGQKKMQSLHPMPPRTGTGKGKKGMGKGPPPMMPGMMGPPPGAMWPPPGAYQPGYGAPPPGYGAPPPGYGAPPPGYGAPPPMQQAIPAGDFGI